MLIVRAKTSIARYTGPAILQDANVVIPQRNHGFYGYRHAFPKAYAVAGPAVIGDVGIFVHFAANSVAAHVANHAVAMCFRMRLHCVADVAQPIPRLHDLNRFPEALFRNVHQLLHFAGYFADSHGKRAVRLPTIVHQPAINAQKLPAFQRLVVGKPVHNRLIQRSADRIGKSMIVLKRGNRAH